MAAKQLFLLPAAACSSSLRYRSSPFLPSRDLLTLRSYSIAPAPHGRWRRKKQRHGTSATTITGLRKGKSQVVKETNDEEVERRAKKLEASLKRRTRSTLGFVHHSHLNWGDGDGDGGDDRGGKGKGEGGEACGAAAHVPVMLGEVLQVFKRPCLRSFVDCTLGAAGHSSAIIGTHPELQLYFGLDVDPAAFELGRSRVDSLLKDHNSSSQLTVYTRLRNFKHIKSVITAELQDDRYNLLLQGIDGILMDLGMSSMQVDDSQRGFSIMGDGPLDMRMNPQASLKAEDILNSWPEAEVGRILREYGEESNWWLLQRMILNSRSDGGLHSTTELVDLVRKASPRSKGRQGWIKTATRVFQALRIAVNDELETLEDALYACFDCLSLGGRLAVISFHSLEDRIVKHTFLDIISKDYGGDKEENLMKGKDEAHVLEEEKWCKGLLRGSNGIILTKRPITPSEEEEKLNQRSRSAKLRVIEKI